MQCVAFFVTHWTAIFNGKISPRPHFLQIICHFVSSQNINHNLSMRTAFKLKHNRLHNGKKISKHRGYKNFEKIWKQYQNVYSIPKSSDENINYSLRCCYELLIIKWTLSYTNTYVIQRTYIFRFLTSDTKIKSYTRKHKNKGIVKTKRILRYK